MSVWKRFPDHGLPSLLTTNVYSRRPIFQSPAAAQILLSTIAEVRQQTRFKLLAFVVMPDHLHLVVVLSSGQSLSDIMRLIKGRFSVRYHRLVGKCGQFWQERYHERTIRNERALVLAIEYVYANPVEAGLVTQAEMFAWSSANLALRSDNDSILG